MENRGIIASVLDQDEPRQYANIWLVPIKHQEITMQVKGLIVLSAVVAAIALSACRREEPVPLKLGAELPVATQPAR
ncbi:hypothetical protein C6Y62_13805 [Hyphomicrobium sulfonivorans]|nr:hypothetical protein [Hyphomicrobium sulfonivorans]